MGKTLVQQVVWTSLVLFVAALSAAMENESRAQSRSNRSHGYFVERAFDFFDTFELHAGVGAVLSADVEATQLAHLGMLGSVSLMYHVEWPKVAEEMVWGFPLSNVLGHILGEKSEGWRRFLICHARYGKGAAEEHRCVLIPLLLTLHKTETSCHFGPPSFDEVPPIRWADCSIGAVVFPCALRVGLSPGEILDFLVGWFGLDIPGSDRKR